MRFGTFPAFQQLPKVFTTFLQLFVFLFFSLIIYEINLYKDEVFYKNLETKKILDEKIQTLVKKSQDEETEIDKEYDYERDGSDSYEEKLSALDRILESEVKLARLENPITELGNYFYHIKLI